MNIRIIRLLIIAICFKADLFAQTITGMVSYTQIDSFGQPTIINMFFDNNVSIYISNEGKKSKQKILANGEVLNVEDKQIAMEQLQRCNKIYNYFRDEEGDVIYKNFKSDSLVLRNINHHDPVITSESIPKINWSLLPEYKKIGTFDCQKATTDFRGRKYVAWFTSKIPLFLGPWKLHGLPGLILEAADDEKKFQYHFKSIEIPLQTKPFVNKKPSTGFIVKRQGYYDYLQKSQEEYVRSIISKASARGVVISLEPGLIERQELED